MAQLMDQLAEAPARAGRPQCLVCADSALHEFLDLGRSPLANNFVPAGAASGECETFPLRVAFCPGCRHVQLLERVPPARMFSDYLYVSSASTTLVGHLDDLARSVVGRVALTPRDLVGDVGSNDGTLLAALARHGVRTLGVDPAANLAEAARARGIPTVIEFFGAGVAGNLRNLHGPAKIITATNSFPHIPDLADYFEAVRRLLADDGWLILEAHYLMDLLDQRAFDTIYHEHVSYWALGPLVKLANRHGFEVVDAERLPLHHGQLRAWIRRQGAQQPSPRVEELLAEESVRGLDRLETYEDFAYDVQTLRHELHAALVSLREQGLRVAGYGAPAKATTLLNYIGAGPDLIEFIADRSQLKQGRLVPGVRIPIVPPERLIDERPDVVLILAWNFADEIMAQLAGHRKRGGRFLLPVPSPRLV